MLTFFSNTISQFRINFFLREDMTMHARSSYMHHAGTDDPYAINYYYYYYLLLLYYYYFFYKKNIFLSICLEQLI